MHDIKWIRENPEVFDQAMARRGLDTQSGTVLALDEKRRTNLTTLQEMQNARNEASKQIGAAKSKGEDANDLIAKVAELKSQLQQAEEEDRTLGGQLEEILGGLPNAMAEDVPDGDDESANVELREWGEKPGFDFEPKEHFDIGEALGLMDFESAANMSGARFVVLSGALARLERALAHFMLDIHTGEFGYTEVSPPLMVRDDAAFGTGQLPKFAEDLFHTDNGFWLISTAEMPLTNLVRESILDGADLPKRYVAYTPCFRSEAGAAGKDTRGLIRQHQFNKVELVSITTAEDSTAEHERLTGCAEAILQRLELAYRVMVLCSGDTGFSAQKTYDLEAWLPGQGRFREISSCSIFGDFQARRMKARYRTQGEKGTRFVHTLNGSGLAVGRTLVAVLENYQQEDGSVLIPEALRPYMNGQEVIAVDGN